MVQLIAGNKNNEAEMHPLVKRCCISPMHLKRVLRFSYSFILEHSTNKGCKKVGTQYTEIIKNPILSSTPRLVSKGSKLVVHCHFRNIVIFLQTVAFLSPLYSLQNIITISSPSNFQVIANIFSTHYNFIILHSIKRFL